MAGTNKVVGLEYIRIRINQVDLVQRVVHGFDKTGSPIVAAWWAAAGGLLHIPQQGETWTAHKLGQIWHLDKLLDSKDQQIDVASGLNPGDTRISTGGSLQIIAAGSTINGQGWGPTYREQFWQPDDGYEVIVLANVPASVESIRVILNGIEVDPTLWVWDGGNTITFTNPPMATGVLVVYYQSTETVNTDAATVTGRAIIRGVEELDWADAATVVGVGHASNAISFGSTYSDTTGTATVDVTITEDVEVGSILAIFAVASGVGADGTEPAVTDNVPSSANFLSDAVSTSIVPDLQVNLMLWEVVTHFASGDVVTLTYDDVVDAIVYALPVYSASPSSVTKTGNGINPDVITVGANATQGIYLFATKGGSSSFDPNDPSVTLITEIYNDTPSGLSLVYGKRALPPAGGMHDVAFTADTSTFIAQCFMALRPA